MDENSPFSRFVDLGDLARDGVSEPAPDPDPTVCSGGDVLPLAPTASVALADPLADGESVRVAVAYPIAICLPESGPHSQSLALSIPGLPESVTLTLTEADAKSLRDALSFAYFQSLGGSELPPS